MENGHAASSSSSDRYSRCGWRDLDHLYIRQITMRDSEAWPAKTRAPSKKRARCECAGLFLYWEPRNRAARFLDVTTTKGGRGDSLRSSVRPTQCACTTVAL